MDAHPGWKFMDARTLDGRYVQLVEHVVRMVAATPCVVAAIAACMLSVATTTWASIHELQGNMFELRGGIKVN